MVLETDTDEACMARVVAGDAAALAPIVNRHGPRLRAIAGGVTRSDAVAEDAVQEAWICVLRGARTWDGRRVGPWLTTIVRNCALEQLRRRQRRPSCALDEAAGLEAGEGLPEDHVLRAEQAARLHEALSCVSPKLRDPLLLQAVAGLDYREIADRALLPIGTVKSRIHRGRRAVRDLVLEPAAAQVA